ncbi:hypothetical protein ES703_26492 [subsurface metagenome]
MAKSKKKISFTFKPGFSIGAVDAEHDPLLEECFIATSCYNQISNINDPHCGIIGRSGTGKTAILRLLIKNLPIVAEIRPDALAFQFLSSSEMMMALRNSHIDIDYFYKLLWRHVFVVEILKAGFPKEARRSGLIRKAIARIKKSSVPDKERDRAIKYLDEWGGSILQAPQERVINIHNELEKRLRAKLGTGSWPNILAPEANIEGEIVTKREESEQVRIVKDEINKIQVQDLNAVKQYLNTDILTDLRKPIFVVIDDLDRFWIEEPLVYDLIRALMLEIYDWADVKNVKIVYVLRDNILEKIESEFTTRSYQREKIDDQRIRLRWNNIELTNLIERRLAAISEREKYKYTHLNELLPSKTGGQVSGKEYIFNRSLDRPRDIIDFFNKAAAESTLQTSISWKNLFAAEEAYSLGRLRSLFDEWEANCPGIDLLVNILRGGPPHFPLTWFSEDDIERIFSNPKLPEEGWLSKCYREFTFTYTKNKTAAISTCRKELLKILYEIGLVGVKTSTSGSYRYAHKMQPILSDSDFENDLEIAVHPAYHKTLGLKQF